MTHVFLIVFSLSCVLCNRSTKSFLKNWRNIR